MELETMVFQKLMRKDWNRIWYHMLQLLEAQYITLTQFTYPGCFGNVQSIYRSLEWSQRYRPHAERNKCSQKIVSTKTWLVKCIAKSTIVANFHTWRFLCGKAPKNETIIINVMQRYFIAWYEAEGQAKWLRRPVPGVDNGWQQR